MLYSSKAPNRYLIGATSEFDNYSVGNTEQGVSWLEHYATERIPELANAHIIKQWFWRTSIYGRRITNYGPG